MIVQADLDLVIVDGPQRIRVAISVHVLQRNFCAADRVLKTRTGIDHQIAGEEAERADVHGEVESATAAVGPIETDLLTSTDLFCRLSDSHVAVGDRRQHSRSSTEPHQRCVRVVHLVDLVEDSVAVDITPRIARHVEVPVEGGATRELGPRC